jgi:hypothetical protein
MTANCSSSTTQLLQYMPAHLPTMATPLHIDPDTIVVASAASGVALFDLAAALATIQAAAAASYEHAAAIEAVPQ